MAPVVLINVFEVEAGREEDFLERWEAADAFMKRQQGFLRTALHRSLGPDARFRFVNVAEWETAEDFRAARTHPEFVRIGEDTPFRSYPALYEQIRR